MGRVWVVVIGCIASVVGCASGYDSEPDESWTIDSPVASAGRGGGSGGRAGASGGQVAAGSCKMGESGLCDCMKPGSRGTRVCRGDSNSQTGGSWGPCMACVDAPPPKSDPGDVSASSGGRGGSASGGSGGARSGSGGSRASGSGGSGEGGRSSRRPSDSGGTPMPSGGNSCTTCNNVCFPVGILACCRIDGSCGCTWAPGAYCL